MNKVVKIVINLLFLINTIILFSCYTHILDFSFIKITMCSIIVLVILIITIRQLKNKSGILNDKKYNIMLFLVNLIVLIIFWRDRFDPLLPIGSVMDIASNYNPSSVGAFADYNMILISLMYAGILMYNLLNRDNGKKINYKKKRDA